jgi:orotidine-5'-phosphate decarboxylase
VTASFLQQLERRALASGSLLCIGLDPHPEFLKANTAAAARDFCMGMIDAASEVACAFKPNSAFFEYFQYRRSLCKIRLRGVGRDSDHT